MEQAIVTGKPPVTDHDVQAGIGSELGLAAETGRLCDEAWGSFQRNRRYGAGRSAIVPGKGKKTQKILLKLPHSKLIYMLLKIYKKPRKRNWTRQMRL